MTVMGTNLGEVGESPMRVRIVPMPFAFDGYPDVSSTVDSAEVFPGPDFLFRFPLAQTLCCFTVSSAVLLAMDGYHDPDSTVASAEVPCDPASQLIYDHAYIQPYIFVHRVPDFCYIYRVPHVL